jgi:hypothetical protein
MKPIVLVGVVLAAVVAGFCGAFVALAVGRQDSAAEAQAAHATHHDAAREVAATREAEPLAAVLSDSEDVNALRQGLVDLQRQLDDLRSELNRREVGGPAAVGLEAGSASVDAVAALQRDAVLKIMADEDKRKQEQRDAERKEREQEMYNRMAERAAKDLGLNAADQKRLAEFMPVASAKRDEIFRGARDNSGGPEGFRVAFDEYRSWRDSELKGTFGDTLGQQLIDYQQNQRGGFDGGGFGGFGGPPGGRDGAGVGGGGGGQGGSQGSGRRGRD